VNPVTGTGCTSVDIGGDANLELVDKLNITILMGTGCINSNDNPSTSGGNLVSFGPVTREFTMLRVCFQRGEMPYQNN